MKKLIKPIVKSAAALAAVVAPLVAPGLVGVASAQESSSVYQCEISINGENYSGNSQQECDALYDELGIEIPTFEAPDFNFDLPTYEAPDFDFPTYEAPDFDFSSFELPAFDLPVFEFPWS